MKSTTTPKQTPQKGSLKSNLFYWSQPTSLREFGCRASLPACSGCKPPWRSFTALAIPTTSPHCWARRSFLMSRRSWAPVPRTLREWAYAGLTFDACAATTSRVAIGEPISKLGFPLLALVLLLVNHQVWRSRASNRILASQRDVAALTQSGVKRG